MLFTWNFTHPFLKYTNSLPSEDYKVEINVSTCLLQFVNSIGQNTCDNTFPSLKLEQQKYQT